MATSQTSENPTHDEITERARSIWIERGRPGGQDLEHWLDAERQLRNERAGRAERSSGAPKGKAVDQDEAERRLDGLQGNKPSTARRTPKGEQL